ncbi:MAG: carbon-nitrogen hydrolase [Verrucomicrobia bacterium]|nr:carbon-nitrogen hydrolase [Verrucomicrobiota bacterium]
MSQASIFTLGLVQMACDEQLDANLSRALEWMGQAVASGATLVCLPELFRSRYFCQREDAALFDLAETIPGPTTQAVGAFCAKHRVTAIASVFEKRAPGLYHNTAVIIGPAGTILGLYRKMHIPDDPRYFEKFYFTPGDLGFRAFDTAVGRVGTLICWDQWYPEGARLTALQGAMLLFYPTAIGWLPEDKAEYGPKQQDAWRTIQRSHAIANGVFVAAANRVGWEPGEELGQGIEFWGSSFICGPDGDILADAPSDKETVLLAEIDFARVERFRRGWPFLRDRRVDAYGGIVQRYGDMASEAGAPTKSP